jgi:uncharacterized surface protein with fasciclin (FAS1) repeats
MNRTTPRIRTPHRSGRIAALAAALALTGAACADDQDANDVADDVTDSVVDAVDEATDDTTNGTTDDTANGTTGDGASDGSDDVAAVESALTDPAVEENVATFLGLLAATGDLPGDGDVTLFVPNDAAFAAAAIENIETLLADPAMIGDVLGAHAVEGVVMSSDLSDGDTVTPVVGDPLTVTVADGTVMIGSATVVQADVEFDGGVIHVIDGVLTLPA